MPKEYSLIVPGVDLGTIDSHFIIDPLQLTHVAIITIFITISHLWIKQYFTQGVKLNQLFSSVLFSFFSIIFLNH
jgi:hypothetical protein